MSVHLNKWDQRECRECHRLGPIFREGNRHGRQTETFASQAIKHHRDFDELDHCAYSLGCVACQVFRRAILLELATQPDEHALVTPQNSPDNIQIRLRRRGAIRWLDIHVPTAPKYVNAVIILSDSSPQRLYPSLKWSEPLDVARVTRLKTWISECHEYHSCANFAFSRANPTWLIRILSPRHIQLVNGTQPGGSSNLLKYVALSYCWGSRGAIEKNSPAAWEKIQASATTEATLQSRQQPFPVTNLSPTLQDAIAIVKGLGVEYIWVDTVCVPQGTWHIEANRMHEIYGNACFTLSSSGAAKATDRLLGDLGAWRDPNKSCRLHGPWLMNVDTPLDVIRTRSPTASRGWTLQEERLSPRILYWCTQRAYWSCCATQRIEAKQPGGLVSEPGTDIQPRMSHPQLFMQLCRTGDTDKLPAEWSELVASFARRHLAEYRVVDNRFAAFSGLAVRYLRATSTRAARNEYLAGLWRFSIAQGLMWSVNASVESQNSLQPSVPSWSWLSVPLGTELNMPTHVEPSSYFGLQMESNVSSEDTDEDIIKKGAHIAALIVSGRARKFVEDIDSVQVPWDGIERSSGHVGFDFSLNPMQPMFSRSQTGRVLVYEAHQQEVIAQLDYGVSDDIEQEPTRDWYVPLGDERELYCLEIGPQEMLLLQAADTDKTTYRRVGAGSGYRKNFFENAGVDLLKLV